MSHVGKGLEKVGNKIGGFFGSKNMLCLQLFSFKLNFIKHTPFSYDNLSCSWFNLIQQYLACCMNVNINKTNVIWCIVNVISMIQKYLDAKDVRWMPKRACAWNYAPYVPLSWLTQTKPSLLEVISCISRNFLRSKVNVGDMSNLPGRVNKT